MGFGSKIHHCTRLVFGQQTLDQDIVTDISLDKNMANMSLHTVQIMQITRISQLIKINDCLVIPAKPLQYKIGTNKTSTASN